MRNTQPEMPAVHQAHRRSPHWAGHRRHHGWVLLIILLLGTTTIVALSRSGTGSSAWTNVMHVEGAPSLVAKTRLATPAVITATGQFRQYPLPQPNSQLMRPAVDHQGRIWFGEMGRNSLAVFDPRTQTFQQMVPPQGHFGIMGLQVASDDTIWFAEQYANYIGHYFPGTDRYQLYPLPRLMIPDPIHPGKMLSLPSAPNELALDAHGMVWFTEFNADALGRLDPRTGRMQHYPLSAKRSVQTLYPYGMNVDPEGRVWFTEMGSNQIGYLSPATGQMRFFTLPELTISPMEIASDTRRSIWVTVFTVSLLLRLDPTTGTFTSYYAPSLMKEKGGLYGLLITPIGDLWVTMLAENALAHLDVAANRFTYYHIPMKESSPFGVAMGTNQTLWFTALDKIGMLRP